MIKRVRINPKNLKPDDVFYRTMNAIKQHVVLEKYDTGVRTTRGEYQLFSGNSFYQDIEEENQMSTKKIYEFELNSGNKVLGSHVGTDSHGMWLMEDSDSGCIVRRNPKVVIEQVPYTFGVKFETYGKEYHFQGTPGSVKIGDILMRTCSSYKGSFCRVTSVDSLNRYAVKKFEGVRVLTEEI